MRPLSFRRPITGLEEHDTWQHAFSDTDTARAIARFVCRVPRHETLLLRPRDHKTPELLNRGLVEVSRPTENFVSSTVCVAIL